MREAVRPGGAREAAQGGFTLVELAVVVMIVGILAGLALPNLRNALLRADAAHMAADARTISLAAYEFLGENGRFPTTGSRGAAPAEMAPKLPDGFAFDYKGVTYWWISLQFPSANNAWRTRNLGILILDFRDRLDLGAAMRSFAGPDAFWTSYMFYYIYRG